MTEMEWLRVGSLEKHVAFQSGQGRKRKLRLYAVACCRQLETLIDDPVLLGVLACAERYADGEISDATAGNWRRKVNQLEKSRAESRTGSDANPEHWMVYHYVSCACLERPYTGYLDNWRLLVHHGDVHSAAMKKKGPAIAHSLLLDIFGNPFREVAFEPAWRSYDAVAIARSMYDSREFSAMPILADALQDAGCDNEDVLNHCREENAKHYRGCWVVDLVLDKQ